MFERILRWTLVAIAVGGLAAGGLAHLAGRADLAGIAFTASTVPVIAGLVVSIVRDVMAGRVGVDAIALVSMSAAIVLGEPLAGAVVALMYSGGNVLEDIAVARAEHDLRALVDRAPREAHCRRGEEIENIPVGSVVVGDRLMVRAGEIVPVDGVVETSSAVVDESALTGEPIPVTKTRGMAILSGSLNAGETFELSATATAGESTYAGIVKLVTAAQTAKTPFVRLADRYALIFLPVSLAIAAAAYFTSGDMIRSLAVLVAATPCPLILAAPVAFIAGVAQAARSGILVKGGGKLEALARAHTVLFDKTGTLTVGGARLLSVEAAPGEDADDVLLLGASLEQASHHVVAHAIVQAGRVAGVAEAARGAELDLHQADAAATADQVLLIFALAHDHAVDQRLGNVVGGGVDGDQRIDMRMAGVHVLGLDVRRLAIGLAGLGRRGVDRHRLGLGGRRGRIGVDRLRIVGAAHRFDGLDFARGLGDGAVRGELLDPVRADMGQPDGRAGLRARLADLGLRRRSGGRILGSQIFGSHGRRQVAGHRKACDPGRQHETFHVSGSPGN
ncbi:MAG: HAD-IC family P-type ATPase, partial [Bradyrhizobium sp.]|nr:HAD-IC family P-type ATPase [Bradyrhizobium sp.]